MQDGAAMGLSESTWQRSSLRGAHARGRPAAAPRLVVEEAGGQGGRGGCRVLSGPDLHISSLKTRSPRFLEVSPGACAGPE